MQSFASTFDNGAPVSQQIGTLIVNQNHQHGQSQSATSWSSGNVHWTVLRTQNPRFVGRDTILSRIEAKIERRLSEDKMSGPECIVITGMGGLGKSEICLKIANTYRDRFWGVFWIDVSSQNQAETGFLTVAKLLKSSASNIPQILHLMNNLLYPVLLILDNADDPSTDYQNYIPSAIRHGVIVVTSRNVECGLLASDAHERLETLPTQAATQLLFDVACIPPSSRPEAHQSAKSVCDMLDSIPLAVIQAGSLIKRGHCTMSEYPEVFNRNRSRFLKFQPVQAQSRYGNLFATFEASAEILSALTRSDETAKHAEELLNMFAALDYGPLPLDIFRTAWGEARILKESAIPPKLWLLPAQLTAQLPGVIDTREDVWNSFALIESLHLLQSLALVFLNDSDQRLSAVFMHPLIHTWAKERQDQALVQLSWHSAATLILLASLHPTYLSETQKVMRPHLSALAICDVATITKKQSALELTAVFTEVAKILNQVRLHQSTVKLLDCVFEHLQLNRQEPTEDSVYLHRLYADSLQFSGRDDEAVQILEILEQIWLSPPVRDLKELSMVLHRLAVACTSQGRFSCAIVRYEAVLLYLQEIRGQPVDQLSIQFQLSEVHEKAGNDRERGELLRDISQAADRFQDIALYDIATQQAFATSYEWVGRAADAVKLRKQIVERAKRTLAFDDPMLLHVYVDLARSYAQAKQPQHVVEVLNELTASPVLTHQLPPYLVNMFQASTHLRSGEYIEAIQMLEGCLRMYEQCYPTKRDERYRMFNVLLGRTHLLLGHVAEAVRHFDELASLVEPFIGMKVSEICHTYRDQAKAYRASGRRAEAIKVLQHSLELIKREVASIPPEENLSSADAKNEPSKRREAFRIASDEEKSQREDGTCSTDDQFDWEYVFLQLDVQCCLARYERSQGDTQEATKTLRSVVKQCQGVFPEDDIDRQHWESLLEQYEVELKASLSKQGTESQSSQR